MLLYAGNSGGTHLFVFLPPDAKYISLYLPRIIAFFDMATILRVLLPFNAVNA